MRCVSALVVLFALLNVVQGEYFHVEVGSSTLDNDFMGQPAWNFYKFYPSALTINQGDSVVFSFKTPVPHSVTWSARARQITRNDGCFDPVVTQIPESVGAISWDGVSTISSGLRTWEDASFEVKFDTNTGTFTLYDVYYPSATIAITVQAALSLYPATPNTVLTNVWTAIWADRAATVNWELNNNINLHRPASRSVARDGKRFEHTVVAGWSSGSASYTRFLPYEVTISLGDVVTFSNRDIVNHLIVFYGKNKNPDFPETAIETNCMRWNPRLLAVHDDLEYTPSHSELASSGVLAPNGKWSLQFTEPGVYYYQDALHSDEGQWGKIVVLDQEDTSDSEEDKDAILGGQWETTEVVYETHIVHH